MHKTGEFSEWFRWNTIVRAKVKKGEENRGKKEREREEKFHPAEKKETEEMFFPLNYLKLVH